MIVIHVGLKKAGSTSLQAFLKENEVALRDLSADYTRVGRRKRPAHHNLASEIQGRRKFDPKYGTLFELSEYWRKAPSSTLLLSSEMFEEAEADQIRPMRELLLRARGRDQFRIVLIIRDLLELIPSSYAQKVKFGLKVFDFDAFFEERMQARRINYFETARRWADVFGWECLRVRLLESRHLMNGDLVDEFMAICGIELKAASVPIIKRSRASNTSPGWKVIEGSRALFGGFHGLPADHPLAAVVKRKGKKDLGMRAVRVGKRMGWNKDKGYYLTRAQAQRCVEVYGASIEALNEYLPEPLPLPLDLESRGFKEREFMPEVTRIPIDELRLFYERMQSLRPKKTKSASSHF